MNTRNKYEEEEKNLASKSAAFVQYLMRRGLLVDQRVLNEDAQRRRQEVARKAYHNTELLLTSYREIVWALESVPDQIASELQMPFATLDELIDRIDLELGLENKRLESRLNSVTKSRLLIDRINEAVSVLKTKPKDGNDMYRVIYKTFMDPNVCRNIYDLFYELNLSKRKYYEIRKKAIRLISLRLWSAPDKEVDVWLDVLMMLNDHQESRSD